MPKYYFIIFMIRCFKKWYPKNCLLISVEYFAKRMMCYHKYCYQCCDSAWMRVAITMTIYKFSSLALWLLVSIFFALSHKMWSKEHSPLEDILWVVRESWQQETSDAWTPNDSQDIATWFQRSVFGAGQRTHQGSTKITLLYDFTEHIIIYYLIKV